MQKVFSPALLFQKLPRDCGHPSHTARQSGPHTAGRRVITLIRTFDTYQILVSPQVNRYEMAITMESFPTHTSKIGNEAASMSVFCSGHPLTALRPRLAQEGIVTARELRRIPSGSTVRVTGILVIVHTPPTRSGKRVMFVTMEDETGLMDLVMFPKAQQECARPILTSEVVTVEGRLQRDGKNGISISIVVEKVIRSWTGLLADFL